MVRGTTRHRNMRPARRLCLWGGAALVLAQSALAQPLPRPDTLVPTPAETRPAERPVDPASGPAEATTATAMPMTLRPSTRPDLSLPPPRPKPVPRMERSCTSSGQHCIEPVSYAPDLCHVIKATAEAAGLDAHFLTRLLWQESRFSSRAVSPAGALGVAQFIPATADLRGLEDPFNPARAVETAAHYLKDLETRFGNLGLAAAAYNGGEARLRRYLRGEGSLPGETRAYVARITGYSVDIWIAPDAPPPSPRKVKMPRFAAPLGPGFHEACLSLATQDAPVEQIIQPDSAPWVVIFAAHPRRDMARRRGALAFRKHEQIFNGAQLTVAEHRLPGATRPFHAAQVGLTDRDAAQRLCTRLRDAGNGCMVLKN